jgi:hypothetical protein
LFAVRHTPTIAVLYPHADLQYRLAPQRSPYGGARKLITAHLPHPDVSTRTNWTCHQRVSTPSHLNHSNSSPHLVHITTAID